MTRMRKGFALIAALLAVVLIGALVAAAMFATSEETKVGSVAVARDVTLTTAESALASAMTTSGLPTSTGLGGTTWQAMEFSGHAVYVYMTRLDSTIYWFVAESVPDASHSGAQRRVGIFLAAHTQPDGSISITPISERAWSELF